MTITPNAMPRKDNLLHQQILGNLLDNKNTVRTEIREKRNARSGAAGSGRATASSDKSGKWSNVKVDVAVPMLAGNVSNENVERAAQRWIK